MSDVELHSLVGSAADTLVSRVYAAIPEGDAELQNLFEQWMGAFLLAMKYAKDHHAAVVANASLSDLLSAFRLRGITSL